MPANSKLTLNSVSNPHRRSTLLEQIKPAVNYEQRRSFNKSTLFSDTETVSLDSSGLSEHQSGYCYYKRDISCLTSSQMTNSIEPQSSSYKPKISNEKYKTELCKNYITNGWCKWSDNCFFAHGKQELRSKMPANQYYKTKICKHYHKMDFCPYASRCQYFHFKTYEINTELLNSYVNKLLPKLLDSNSNLNDLLSKNERMQQRLSVFQTFCAGDEQKSLYVKFVDDEF